MKHIFITGISGLLGTNLCHELLDKGYYVTGLVRDKNSYIGNTHENLNLLEGQLFDDFSSLFKTIDVVIHAAAVTNQGLLDYSDYWAINCNATKQLYTTAILCNVERFIFVSSANTLGYGTLKQLGNEKKQANNLFKQSYYAKSKIEAEKYLVRNKYKIETIIVNPTFMLGAYDSKPSSGKIILIGWNKKVVFYPPGGKNFVHVKDVAIGIIKAMNKGVSGEKYLLANKNLSYKTFYKTLNQIVDQNPIMVEIPKSVLVLFGYCGNLLRKIGIKSSLSLINMKILCIENYFSNKKSVKHLNMEYQPIENALNDAVDYFSNPKN
ncbi:NAD dependent epimerase/dehydratase family protein [Tenacibaculum sp. MAR_2009_124]|uniref:NAD-dependent epimerase/dehydratase family protein n=1 Tax=Tenacibaculum sp. MAR_2009_124 TaxID=1250059 RepID=UPI00089C1BE7|nr:NAD-dependent epimerase/dehydratase family protein [Tenacibaculum sp. MAR_2009_124]SEB46975.1 NAD dependent epimerase/dehydratase family protein [Tenacibaculum sp. MAR_2009_124]